MLTTPLVIGLIQDGDESAYRLEVEWLVSWCSQHNLELNTLKTVEMMVDFRKQGGLQVGVRGHLALEGLQVGVRGHLAIGDL